MKTLARLLVSILFISSPSYADKINVFEFTEAELLQLEVRKVRGADNKTNYSVGSNDNGNYLRAEAKGKASGLGKEITINLLTYHHQQMVVKLNEINIEEVNIEEVNVNIEFYYK